MKYPFHNKFDGKNTYFISDQHYSHKNIVLGESNWSNKSGCRDFQTVHEMNQAITESYKILNKDSVLFILGDILFGNKSLLKQRINEIPCEIHYLAGNHCDFIRKDVELQKLFSSFSDYQEIYCSDKIGKYHLCCLFHYPIKSWRDCNKGSYVFSGHCHGSLPYNNNERGLDMDWNIWRRPMNFCELDEILSKKPYKKLEN